MKKMLYEKLLNIQNELKAPKSQFNNFGKYKYRNAEDILESVKPLCLKQKVALILTDEIVVVGERYYIKATARIFDDKESLEVTAYAREEENKKGMDGSQVTGASSSYARKYALNGLFNIDDTKDSDSTNTHGKEENNDTEKKLTDKQIQRLFTLGQAAGYTKDQIFKHMTEKFRKDTPDLLTKAEYDMMCVGYEKVAKANEKK